MICEKCGAQVNDGAAFCPICGAGIAAPAQPVYAAPAAEEEYDEAKDAADNKLFAILSYFGILWLIPLFAAPKSKFARFHANQGIIVTGLWVAAYIIQFILNLIKIPRTRPTYFGLTETYYIRPLGWIGWILLVGVGVMAIIGLLNAIKGEKKELPLIGKFQILK